MTTPRPMPADFAEVARTLTYEALQARYNVGKHLIGRWRAELGVETYKPQEMPADFAEMAGRMTFAMLRRHYGASENRITNWISASGVKPCTRQTARKPAPADFRDVAPTLTQSAMIRHFRADVKTIRRWLAETGVKAAEPPKSVPPRRAQVAGGIIFRDHPGFRVGRHDLRQMTLYDEAADVIRRVVAVYRCNERGAYDDKGSHWRVGTAVLTPDELLARADRYRRKAA